MKNIITYLSLILIFSLDLYSQDSADTSDCLHPTMWTRLTEFDGEWVIYHYCYAGIAPLEHNKYDNDIAALTIFSSQDSDIYEVFEIYLDNDRCCLRVKNRFSYSGETKVISLCYLHDSRHTSEWDVGGSDGKAR